MVRDIRRRGFRCLAGFGVCWRFRRDGIIGGSSGRGGRDGGRGGRDGGRGGRDGG